MIMGRKIYVYVAGLLMAIVALLFIFTSPKTAYAAASEDNTTVSDIIGQGEGYSAVLYDNTSGLPTSEANAIVETEDGFLWIGCYSGLISYDGNDFSSVGSYKGTSNVGSLFVDSKQRLWVGTNDAGAVLVEKDSVKYYKKADGLSSLMIQSIVENADGTIFFGTSQGVAYVDTDLNLHML
ncbi:MAG: histidine kinase, partial [Butyrivibrio sp.]|nr:histidine kinase [Butyrivibrio sp.]